MKQLLTFLCFSILSIVTIPVIAQEYSAGQVSQFANCLSKWTSTHREEYRFEAEDLCNGPKKPIVNDELSHILTKKANPQAPLQKNYELDTYLNNIGSLLKNGAINIAYTNITKVSKDEIIFETKISEKDLNMTELYSCNIQVTGDILHNSKELFYVYKHKITKIGKYEKRGGKVVVDFDDFINDYETIGFTYNYGENFPVGGSFNYSLEDAPFMFSVDFGVNFDNDKYITDKVEMKDIMNYKRKRKEMDPKFFVTVTPQFYLKYFAIGCGVGALCMYGNVEEAEYSYTSNTISSSNITSTSSTSYGGSSDNNDLLFKPMIRPVAKGFIPLRSDELYLSISVGYDLVFGYTDKNGINFGLGLQWEL